MANKKDESYEQMVKRRKAENMQFLQNLGIDELKTETSALITQTQKKKQVKTEPSLKPMEPTRRSSRLKNIPPEALSNSVNSTGSENISFARKVKPHGVLNFKDHTLHMDETLTAKFLKDCSVFVCKLETEQKPRVLSRYKQQFQSMKINSSLVTKLVPNRIVAIAVHPSNSKRLVAVGSKYGQLGFWDVDKGSDGMYVYEPHSDRISCLEFNPHNPAELYTMSFDGTLRSADLEKAVFNEIYRIEDDASDARYSSFDILSPSSFLLSHRSGIVTLVDKRIHKRKAETSHEIEDSLKTVHSHPLNKHQFVAAAKYTMSLWDLRHMKKSISEFKHPKTVNAAYFSPVTGKYIISTSLDDKLNLFNVSTSGEITKNKSISHNNFTGRWLTPFRTVWLPNNEDLFLAASMKYPRRIEVFHVDGHLEHEFCGEDLGSVCSVNAFHPSQPFLAGGNSSGRVHVFYGTN